MGLLVPDCWIWVRKGINPGFQICTVKEKLVPCIVSCEKFTYIKYTFILKYLRIAFMGLLLIFSRRSTHKKLMLSLLMQWQPSTHPNLAEQYKVMLTDKILTVKNDLPNSWPLFVFPSCLSIVTEPYLRNIITGIHWVQSTTLYFRRYPLEHSPTVSLAIKLAG